MKKTIYWQLIFLLNLYIDFVQKIKSIGETRECSDEDLFLFLPNFPLLRGSEFIFNIRWANSVRYNDNEIESFVKGLHLIEEKYKAKTGYDFGFGSPSLTFMVIQRYAEYDYQKAVELEKWVALNGGNYYIAKILKPENFRSQFKTESMISEIRQREKERKLAKIRARKIISDKKIEAHNKKVESDRTEKDKIACLLFEQLLKKIIEDDSRPIYFYENEIFKIDKEQVTKDCKIKIEQLINKIAEKNNSKIRKIIKHLTAISS